MKLQIKVLAPILLILILAFFLMSYVTFTAIRNVETDVLSQMDEKNIALAKSLAVIISENPDQLQTAKMVQLASLFGVDEVHVTDANGILLWGNIPDFFGFDFSTSDQTIPLLGILNNPNLAIAQEPQPRGTDNVMFQYISVSRTDQKGIVQVGVSMETFEKIDGYKTKALYTSILYGILATLIVMLITIVLIRWILRKIYWYENILDCIPLPVSITDNNMKWTFINTAVENFLGKKRAEVLGQSCSNWGAAICNTPNCGVKCVERGQESTTFSQMGMDFKVDTAFLTDKNGNKTGHIELVQDITEMVKNQKAEAKLVQGIENISQSFVYASKQIADGAQALAQGSTDQAESIEALSNTITEINSMAKETTQTATVALDEVQQAGELMGVSMEKMNQMLEAMQKINEGSQSIFKTTKAIDDIAFQTNILALNAAVEAARAGQHGKGFAVVAEEVRNLASKSAEAAKETSKLIENSNQSVAEGSKIVQQVNESLQAVAELAVKNAEKIASVQSLSTQQSASMDKIHTEIDQVAQIVQQNSATAEESAAAAEEMSGQASSLDELIYQFNHKKQ